MVNVGWWVTIGVPAGLAAAGLVLGAVAAARPYRPRVRPRPRPGGSPLDVVIPVGPHDADALPRLVACVRANVVGLGRVYVVSFDPALRVDGCTVIPEAAFPFSKADVVAHGPIPAARAGWYLQQLIKLHAGRAIPDLSPHYLVVDADTFFLKPTTFVEGGRGLFNTGTEYHPPYFAHMLRLHPDFRRVAPHSGVVHHMVFARDLLEAMMARVQDHHGGRPFWQVFLGVVDPAAAAHSGASEYELYYNYVRQFAPDRLRVRRLLWRNQSRWPSALDGCLFAYVSVHWYKRR